MRGRLPATFAGAAVDRVSEQRHDARWVEAQRADPRVRFLLTAGEGVVVEGEPAAPRLRRVRVDELPQGALDGLVLLLGLEPDGPLFGVDLGADALWPADGGGRLVPLREAGALLPQSEGGLAASLRGLVNWHRRHGFCAACGAPTRLEQGGYSRRCTRCGTEHFPRTDPAVIMLVHAGDRVLMGRRGAWPERRYSVLAGFVSPGEALEEAVLREVWEESGVRASDPRFVASQPWPFPASLMIGFTASSEGGDPVARDGELVDVRWFALEEVRAALSGGTASLVLPPSISIAHLLIEAWAHGRLP